MQLEVVTFVYALIAASGVIAVVAVDALDGKRNRNDAQLWDGCTSQSDMRATTPAGPFVGVVQRSEVDR